MSSFSQFQLHENLMKALEDIGYEKPSPIQVETIPHILMGCDVIGQAQTGTGKTAAFALPLLSKLDKNYSKTQILVLTPTRELTIQVSEALKKYAKYMKGVEVLPIYGGQSYSTQIRALKYGATIVVGTPGRVMDHMRKGTLDLTNLRCMVLDEADEMLNMGFLDDIQWIIEQCPKERQMVLFSATMPKPIQKIAQRYLKDPINVAIKSKTATASTINQRFIKLRSVHKLDALTRILESEVFDGLIIFTRTKQTTLEVAEKLKALNFKCAAINGDMEQK
ncbi:MAG TPA: DEAD/DEAH box helicase, partial [Gammaproteobacteria bacterium]|nr:DEAD/DEAH box helicase [Gammaproteobacteria bacterium]